MQQQASQAFDQVKKSGAAESNLKDSKQQLNTAKQQMEQCEFLRQKLIKLYKM